MNISPHPRVRHLLKKREGRCRRVRHERREKKKKKVGNIEMHEESSQFLSWCPVSSVSYAPPPHSLVYRNRKTACKYPLLSCNVVSVEMCVRKRWFMMGVWWEWRVMSCYCRRCHKMFVSNPPNGSVHSLRSTSLGDSEEEEASPLPPPPAYICVSVMWGGIHWQTGYLKSQRRL